MQGGPAANVLRSPNLILPPKETLNENHRNVITICKEKMVGKNLGFVFPFLLLNTSELEWLVTDCQIPRGCGLWQWHKTGLRLSIKAD